VDQRSALCVKLDNLFDRRVFTPIEEFLSDELGVVDYLFY